MMLYMADPEHRRVRFEAPFREHHSAVRAYARFRSELRHGKLTLATLERIALAVAEYYRAQPGIAMHSRTARAAGLPIDEVAAAREFTSKDPREAAKQRGSKVLELVQHISLSPPSGASMPPAA